MADLKRFNDLKKQVEQEQQKADRAEGALEQLHEKLKEEFNCTSLQDAEDKLKELQKKKEKAEKAFDSALQDFDEKWGSSDDDDA